MWWCLYLGLSYFSLSQAEETCLSVDDNPYLFFGSKTAYNFVNSAQPTSRVHDVPGCRPVAFWMLIRHGSHLPEANEFTELQNLENLKRNIVENYVNRNYKNFNQRMCTADVNLLERWSWNPRHNVTRAGELTSEGYLDGQRMAQGWRERYPQLLTGNRHDYLFKYMNEQRAATGLRGFTEGLFGQQAETIDIPRENDERLLRPYKYCPAWKKDVGDNNDTLAQVRIFESKAEYREMISNISRRLGYNYEVDSRVVKDMYQMCRYNKAWDVAQLSPWCAVFSKPDLERLEYAEDLETYYKYGFGSEINGRTGCPLVQDMMGFFNTQILNEGLPQQPKSRIYLTDYRALLLMSTALGAHRDGAPLTGDNYHGALVQSRRWRTSQLVPYSANLAVVLYRCNNMNNNPYRVLFLNNERPVQLEGCRVGLCEWDVVRARYEGRCDPGYCDGGHRVTGLGLTLLGVGVILNLYV